VQVLVNLVHVQKMFVGGYSNITKDWKGRSNIPILTFLYYFGHKWSYKRLLIVLASKHPYLSIDIWHAF